MKLIFLDVDGTLCLSDGTVPESAKTAIQKARKKGNKIYLSTGRSNTEIYSHIWDIGFDGIVGSAGAYVECDGKVIFHQVMGAEDIKKFVEFAREEKANFVLEGNDGIYVNKRTYEYLKTSFGMHNLLQVDESAAKEYLDNLKMIGEEIIPGDINKIIFSHPELTLSVLLGAWGEIFTIVPCSIPMMGKNSVEISAKNITKATGMQKVLDYINQTEAVTNEDVIAIGDGPNDFEMLEYAKVGIAMENAGDMLKRTADDVTDTAANDGIYKAFLKYMLC